MDLQTLRTRVSLRDDLIDRLAHARDLWPRTTLGLVSGHLPPLPRAIVFPRNAEELSFCLTYAQQEGVPVVPYGAGSGVCGAASGREGSLVIDLKGMRRIGAIQAPSEDAHGWVDVEPGVLGQHLEDHLEARGFCTRHSPSSIWCSTVGGWAASRSAGQFSSRYGKFEDMVMGLKVTAPTGAFGTGCFTAPGEEDLGPWVMGSEGALGIIHDLRVRIHPSPEKRWLRGYRFASLEQAWAAMRGLLQAGLYPAVLRLYDPVDTRLAGKDTVHHEKKEEKKWLSDLRDWLEGIPGVREQLLRLPLSLPRLVNRLADGVATGCVLIVGWEGRAAVVDQLVPYGQRILADAGGDDLGPGPGEHWYNARHEVSYKLAPVFERGGFADTMEVATRWSGLADLYAAVREAIGRHGVVMAHFSHAYVEGCSIYFSFAGVGNLDVYDALWQDALAAAASVGATVAHHHGVGQLKMAAAAREMAGIAPLFRAIKQRVDPHQILNPGRMFPDVTPPPEPPAPPIGVDPVSRLATLPAWQPAAARDAWLSERGHALRFPTPEPLAASLRGPHEPYECRVIGASAHIEGRRVVLPAVPRSAAGPDPRAELPPERYETLTVPVVPLQEPAVIVRARPQACVHAGLLYARVLGPDLVEFRGPAAAAQAEAAEKLQAEKIEVSRA